jgi:hypothetical protein
MLLLIARIEQWVIESEFEGETSDTPKIDFEVVKAFCKKHFRGSVA